MQLVCLLSRPLMKRAKMAAKNLTWHHGAIKREDRLKLLGHKNKVVWLTGLSSSGKSTIARKLEELLYKKGILSYVLDGDNIRHGLNSNLGFSREDREENIRRIAEVAKLFYDSGCFVIVAFISPYKKDRRFARKLIGDDFVCAYVKCSLKECKARDPKGLYKKAREGKIANFTGISDKYEAPENPEIIIDSEKTKPEEAAKKIMDFILNDGQAK